MSCAKPDDPVSSSQLESDLHVVSCAKPTVGGNKPSMVGVKKKKKVWGVKKNGLYGWKMVVVDKRTSPNIHTKKHNIQPTSNQKATPETKPQQNNFEKWLVTPKLNVGGGGHISDSCEVSTSKSITKILEKES